MSDPTPEAYCAICSECWGQNPRCARCLGAQYVIKHPYAPGAGEAGDDLADLLESVKSQHVRETPKTARLVPVRQLERLAELADLIDGPELSAAQSEMVALAREIGGQP